MASSTPPSQTPQPAATPVLPSLAGASLDQVLAVFMDAINSQGLNGSGAVFHAFDPESETWETYKERFEIFCNARAVAKTRMATYFLSVQTSTIWTQISNNAKQLSTPKSPADLTLSEIFSMMAAAYDPKKIVPRERFKFWTLPDKRPGESFAQLANRIRQAASTCDFQNISDPLDEAMRTKFLCACKDERFLQGIFREEQDLSFEEVVNRARRQEEVAKAASESLRSTLGLLQRLHGLVFTLIMR